jgi:quercetin dioxygenase-like cupin family protein
MLLQLLIQEKEPIMRVWYVTLLSIIVVLTSLVVPPTWAGEHSGHMMFTPTDLQWTDSTSLPKGAKVVILEGPITEAVPFTFRAKFPANYQVPPHWHPAIERVTVLSGTLNLEVGDTLDQSKTKALTAGSISIMEPKMHHFAWTDEETIVQVSGMGPWGITYVNPADDPRKK